MNTGMLPLTIILSAVGPAVIVLGFVLMLLGDRRRMRDRVRTRGTIVRWDHAGVGATTPRGVPSQVTLPGPSGRPRPTVSSRRLRSLPVVRFRTAGGEAVETLPAWAADPIRSRTGVPVDVLYRERDPRDIRVQLSWRDRPWSFVVLIGIGLTVLLTILPLTFRMLAG